MAIWPLLNTLKALSGFLGLTGYYRKFVKGYGNIAPLNAMLRKGKFKCNEEFKQNLKQSLLSSPFILMPNFNLEFINGSDVSGLGVNAVQM